MCSQTSLEKKSICGIAVWVILIWAIEKLPHIGNTGPGDASNLFTRAVYAFEMLRLYPNRRTLRPKLSLMPVTPDAMPMDMHSLIQPYQHIN